MAATAGDVAGQGTQYLDQYRHRRQQDEHNHRLPIRTWTRKVRFQFKSFNCLRRTSGSLQIGRCYDYSDIQQEHLECGVNRPFPGSRSTSELPKHVIGLVLTNVLFQTIGPPEGNQLSVIIYPASAPGEPSGG